MFSFSFNKLSKHLKQDWKIVIKCHSIVRKQLQKKLVLVYSIILVIWKNIIYKIKWKILFLFINQYVMTFAVDGIERFLRSINDGIDICANDEHSKKT